MFVLSSKPTYWFKVAVKRPNDEKGTWDTIEFMAEFKRRSLPEMSELLKKPLADLQVIVPEEEFVSWKDVKQPDGSVLECTAANRTVLLAELFVQGAIFNAWWESSVAGPAKN